MASNVLPRKSRGEKIEVPKVCYSLQSQVFSKHQISHHYTTIFVIVINIIPQVIVIIINFSVTANSLLSCYVQSSHSIGLILDESLGVFLYMMQSFSRRRKRGHHDHYDRSCRVPYKCTMRIARCLYTAKSYTLWFELISLVLVETPMNAFETPTAVTTSTTTVFSSPDILSSDRTHARHEQLDRKTIWIVPTWRTFRVKIWRSGTEMASYGRIAGSTSNYSIWRTASIFFEQNFL